MPKVRADYFSQLWSGKKEVTGSVDTSERDEADTFTMEELKAVLKTVRNGKAPGSDKIPMELFKYATSGIQRRLLNFLNIICREGKLTDDLKSAIVVPIFKKGDLSKMENYPGISLLSTAYKILAKLIARRLTDLSEGFLLECQHGFRKGRSCTDASYTVKLIMEKQIEFNKQTHICFIDFEKAYDKVDRARLFDILVKRNIPGNLIWVLKTIYADTRICVRLEREMSKSVEINGGVRQGCPASCILFNIYIDEILQRWYKTGPKGIRLGGRKSIEAILFADDMAVLAEDEDSLQRSLYNLNAIAKEFNMKISAGKTKVMAFLGKEPIRSKIVIDGKVIEQVNVFTYLGTDISYLGRS